MDGFAPAIVQQLEASWTEHGEAYQNTLKKQQICTKDGLIQFNWVLNIPLENQILTDSKSIFKLDASDGAKAESRLVKDSKAPLIEMSFTTSKPGDIDGENHTMRFNKIQL